MPDEKSCTELHFDADAVTGGSVSKDGAFAAIEFVVGDQRLWVTLPAEVLCSLTNLSSELDALRHDAKNGVACRWYITSG